MVSLLGYFILQDSIDQSLQNIGEQKLSKYFNDQAKEARKQKRESIKKINLWAEDVKKNPQKYCRHDEGDIVPEGIKCKSCGFVEKI